jgi:hypothetical protein
MPAQGSKLKLVLYFSLLTKYSLLEFTLITISILLRVNTITTISLLLLSRALRLN